MYYQYLQTIGDHKEFLKRITKTLYYGELPRLPCLSLPVTGMYKYVCIRLIIVF